MSALGRAVSSGAGRRRVQTLVIGLTAMMAVTASVLGGSLLVVSGAPFDDAFARRHGAHLSVEFDAARTAPGRPRRPGAPTGWQLRQPVPRGVGHPPHVHTPRTGLTTRPAPGGNRRILAKRRPDATARS